MSSIKIKLNPPGPRELMQGPEIQADIARRAAAIAAAAGSGRHGGEFGHDVVSGRTRVHGMVWTEDFDAMLAEAVDRALTRAVDAGRG